MVFHIKILTELDPVSTVYIEGLVAFVYLSNSGVEHKTIGTQLGGGNAINTLIEFVALLVIFVLTVLIGTFELGACNKSKQC